jgi:hypothetical protein
MPDITNLVRVLLALVAVPARPPHAGATAIERAHYNTATVDDYELCGIEVHQEGEFAGTVHFRVGKGAVESAYFAHDHFAYAFTITNPANGRYFTTEGKAVLNEITAIRIGETAFEFTQIEAGQTFVLRDPSGRAVLRDRGRARITLLFETLGDPNPGREQPAVLYMDLAGPHPGFLYDDEGRLCSVVQQLLG